MSLSGTRIVRPGQIGSDALRDGYERTVTVDLTGNQAARSLGNPTDEEAAGAVGEALGDYFTRPAYDFACDPGAVDFI